MSDRKCKKYSKNHIWTLSQYRSIWIVDLCLVPKMYQRWYIERHKIHEKFTQVDSAWISKKLLRKIFSWSKSILYCDIQFIILFNIYFFYLYCSFSNINYINMSFLVSFQICRDCKNLSTLRITYSYVQNREVIKSICLALSHAQSLLHFRLEAFLDEILMDQILQSLPNKLRAIFLMSNCYIYESNYLLHFLLKEREQLQFLCFVVRTPLKKLKQICSNFKKQSKNTGKIIVMEYNYADIFPKIPSAYSHIVTNESQISSFNFFNFNWESVY